MSVQIGFMQGRLSDPIDGKIQAFPWATWETEFASANEIGFDVMEWTIDHDRLYENPLMSELGRKSITELMEQSSIKVKSLTGDCFMQAPFYKASSDRQKTLLNDLDNILFAASLLDISKIIFPVVDGGRIENDAQLAILSEALLKRTTQICSLNLKILFESDLPPKALASFISLFPKEAFGLNYDTGNSASLGFNALDEFDAYGERIENVHIKDRPFQGSTVPLGIGDANFEMIFKALKKIGYDEMLILQTARASNGNHSEVLMDYYKLVFGLWNKNGS